jgi:DNA replication protein DnaC
LQENSSSSDESISSSESSKNEESESTSGSDDEGSTENEESDDDDEEEEEEGEGDDEEGEEKEEEEQEKEQPCDWDGDVNVGEERELQPFQISPFQARRIERETYFAQNLQDKMAHVQSEERDVDLAGVIIKLELYNFMCHSYLSLNFNKHINFIIGRNGSGKSAIMAAIMVALGTKASDTYRGRNLAG